MPKNFNPPAGGCADNKGIEPLPFFQAPALSFSFELRASSPKLPAFQYFNLFLNVLPVLVRQPLCFSSILLTSVFRLPSSVFRLRFSSVENIGVEPMTS